MRDLFKILIVVGFLAFFEPSVLAENYKLLVLPDNIATQNASIDSYIYDATAEFFADEIVTLMNMTDYIQAKSVSSIRTELKDNPSVVLTAKNLTNKFKTTYNVDYNAVKRLAKVTDNRYVLLITSTIDAENYILRRTWWDFFNIAGASVIDPAYKINTYAVLIDSQTSQKLWSDTYYKTISVVENRIITRGPSPQTEQLGKIKDYSRYVCPRIAYNVQTNILPTDVLLSESKVIKYDIGNLDNVFTKKYRHYGTECGKIYNQKKGKTVAFFDRQKSKHAESKRIKAEKKAAAQRAKLEVQAEQVYNDAENLNKINNNVKQENSIVKDAVYKTDNKYDESLFEPINIKRIKKNNLFGRNDSDRPCLRDYSK